MELLSRRPGYVAVGCKACQIQITMPEAIWNTAVLDRAAAAPRQE
jgi:hypothetical protein